MTSIEKSSFGVSKQGEEISLYTLRSSTCSVGVINFGATIVSLCVPDKNGKIDDIVTGFDSIEEYYEKSRFFGCVVGRVANRIGKGKFTLDGSEYSLAINNGPNALHGGLVGFDKKIWSVVQVDNGIALSIVSPDGDQGYPGELTLTTTYILKDSELSINYKATTTKATPINITNHSYFNLGGHDSWKNLSKHEITLQAHQYLPSDTNCLVTGEVKEVDGTPFDLRKPTLLTESLLESISGGGLDHNMCLSETNERKFAANVCHVENGRKMKVETTCPGIQLYTSNFLSGEQGKKQVKYHRHSALCLETQNWPDAINHVGTFPNCVLRPNQEFNHSTWFTFSS